MSKKGINLTKEDFEEYHTKNADSFYKKFKLKQAAKHPNQTSINLKTEDKNG